MSSTTSGEQLPQQPSLDQLRKQAKELRVSGGYSSLSAAQLALATRFGFASWPKLKLEVEHRTLKRLIQDGEVGPVRDFLVKAPRLTKMPFSTGETPLHVAAEENRPEIVELLVGFGASFDAKFAHSSHTALSWAVTSWSFDSANKLVELGDKPDLFCAAGLGRLDLVQAFWKDGKLRVRPSRTGSSRVSDAGERLPRPPETDLDQVSDALYIACRTSRLDVARWLLDRGADPNWRGYVGASCLAWAEFSGDDDLCALLRERGGRDDVLDQQYDAPPRQFAIMVMAGWGFEKKLSERLEKDASLALVQTPFGTPLHAAAAEGQLGPAKVLLRFGADPRVRNDAGKTAAEIAAERGYAEVAELLALSG